MRTCVIATLPGEVNQDFIPISINFFKKDLQFASKKGIILSCNDESSDGILVQRETAVGESRRQVPRESAFGARGESHGVVSLIVRLKVADCQTICNLGGNTEAFSSHTPRGEKAFFAGCARLRLLAYLHFSFSKAKANGKVDIGLCISFLYRLCPPPLACLSSLQPFRNKTKRQDSSYNRKKKKFISK